MPHPSRVSRRLLPLIGLLALGACQRDQMVGVPGVDIERVAIYQGVERNLAEGDEQLDSNVPLIAGRDALLRVFYTADSDAEGEEITAQLTLEGEDEPRTMTVTLEAESEQDDLDTTINFYLEGDAIGDEFNYSVSLLTIGQEDNEDAHHPAVDEFENHDVEGEENVFRIVLVPYQYNADGSGRLPDLSDEAIEEWRTRLLGLYPVSDVEIEVRDPVPWPYSIQPFGGGWQEVLIDIFERRAREVDSQDVYYYGIFNPVNSAGQFCQQGCLLGVTLLNNNPAGAGDPYLRAAIGVGFSDVGLDTGAHELGHSHGREHVNCGQGIDPSSIDRNYPHNTNSIGTWGYDIVNDELKDPNRFTDIMGYCDRQWVSDHNFIAFHERGQNVNEPRYDGPPIEYQLITYDELGKASWRSSHTRRTPMIGDTVPVWLSDDLGQVQEVEATFYRYDHLPGGWLFVPQNELLFEPTIVETAVDGLFVSSEE